MKRTLYLLLFIWGCGWVSAQTIHLYFPHFAGVEYDFYLIEGEKNDTLSSGAIPADGRLTLRLPESRSGYAGMARWLLKGGGGLDVVVNGEDFSVACTEKQPSDETIVYRDSPENDFLRGRYFRQQKLLQKAGGLQALMEAYKEEPESLLYPLLRSEREKQEEQYADLVNEMRRSDRYAARYRRISDLYNGLPLYELNLDGDGEEKADEENEAERRLNEQRRFIDEELDMDALYTSGLWKAVIAQAAGLYPDKTEYAQAMIGLLERTRSQRVVEQLAVDLVSLAEQYNQPVAGEIIVDYLMDSGRIRYPGGVLEKAFAKRRTREGMPAPALSQGGLPEGKVLLVFYETGCGPCETEMQRLRNRYPQLKERGYEVVSVSADRDLNVFNNTAKQFPWPQKLCDGKGLDGEDFKNYGVIGTPTLVEIDEEGVVRGRYASVETM